MPCERLNKDIAMMKETGINVVQIAESTRSTVEPKDGTFDFSHVDRTYIGLAAIGWYSLVIFDANK